MNTQALKNRLGGKLSLPSLPEVVVRMMDLLRDPGCGMKELGETMASDPPLTARVLRIANSAYYSLRVPILDIRHAAAILGLDALHSLLLEVGVLQLIEKAGSGKGFDPRELWDHSVLTAKVASRFPDRLMRGVKPAEVYVCGLLHDIGKFVMFEQLRDEYLETIQGARRAGLRLNLVEMERFEFDHAEVGALVAERWGLPPMAIRAIGHHHLDRAAMGKEPVLVAVIALADEICKRLAGARNTRLATPLPEPLVECLELKPKELERLLEQTLEFQVDRAA